MSVDFQKIFEQIKAIGAGIHEKQESLEERRALARMLFHLYSDDLEQLRYKIEAVKAADPSVRCAIPQKEYLDFHTSPSDLPTSAVLIAADGSQIMPDRHSPIQYGLVNVGAIVMRLNDGEAPAIFTESQMLFGDSLFTSTGAPLTDGMLALMRDTEERSRLLELARQVGSEASPVITFTDGPIELWNLREGDDAGMFDSHLQKYLSALTALQQNGIITAGYIDKPFSDWLVRLLELTQATDEDIKNLREFHPLRGVTDRWLVGDEKQPLLGPGERSAVFGLQSRSEKEYQGALALHFFYINVSADERHPKIARVDIPRWVADDQQKLDNLHAAILQQCRILGAKPYPYLLHRAHEIARVSLEEKHQVDQMLQLELRRHGAEIGELSNKQSAKDGQGRTSY